MERTCRKWLVWSSWWARLITETLLSWFARWWPDVVIDWVLNHEDSFLEFIFQIVRFRSWIYEILLVLLCLLILTSTEILFIIIMITLVLLCQLIRGKWQKLCKSYANICKSCNLFYSKKFRTITKQTINFQLTNSKLNE